MYTEQQLQSMGYESQWKWNVSQQAGGEIRQAMWGDKSGRFSFYVKGVPMLEAQSNNQSATPSTDLSAQFANVFAIMKEAAVQGDPNMHKTLNFPSPAHEQAFLAIVQQGQFQILPARWVTKDLGIEYCQRWSQDSQDGRYKAGQFVLDPITNQPRIYRTIRAAVLCDFSGQPIEDPIKQCRNKLNANLKPNPQTGFATYTLANQVFGAQGGAPSNPVNMMSQNAYNPSGQPVNLGAPIGAVNQPPVNQPNPQQQPPQMSGQQPPINQGQGFVVNQTAGNFNQG